MYCFSVSDLRKVSGIGQRTEVELRGGDNICGTLKRIDMECITVLDRKSGLEVDIPNGDIDRIIYEGYSKEGLTDRAAMKKFQRQCERAGEESKLSFGHMFSRELERYASECARKELAKYLRSEQSGKGAHYHAEEYELFYRDFLAEDVHRENDRKTACMINTLLLFRMKKYHMAMASVLERLEEESMEDIALTMICLLVHMKSYMQALYWMERFYLNRSPEGSESADQEEEKKLSLWWFYLRVAGRFTSYEYAIPLMRDMAKNAPQEALKSLAYLLMMNNSVSAAIQVLACDDENLTAAEAEEILERNSSYLVPDTDNNYHRFARCMTEILENGDILAYEDGEDISGYVYDYIPDREFGFILGFDLIVYFFRKESITSDNVEKQIRNNICSVLSVEEEDLVSVTFQRTSESKRSYAAVNIV